MSHAAIDTNRVLAKDNVTLPARSAETLWRFLLIAGLVLSGLVVVSGAFGTALNADVALHALHTGFLVALSIPVGGLGVVLMMHLTKAGWSSTSRRQFENLMMLFRPCALLFGGILLVQLLYSGVLFTGMGEQAPYLWDWMNPAHQHGAVYEHKAPFLNIPFFLLRAVIYFGAWIGITSWLYTLSRRQDSDGNKWHTATAAKVSAPSAIAFAFITAFAGFDWLMSLDYKWFSTMLGVYVFAMGMVSALSVGTFALIMLRGVGRLHAAFTEEHLHDLSKLLFSFVVFWAYIGFSQYMLIWYASIPEEANFFALRKGDFGGAGAAFWNFLSWFIPIVKFIIPFIILLPRPLRRRPGIIALMCVWVFVMNIVEMYWMVRPEVGAGFAWIDILGAAGPVLIVLGLFVRRIASAPLVPINDPRMDESLGHWNTI